MRVLLRGFFNIMEWIARKLGKWELVPNTELEYFYLSIIQHKGQKVILQDGSVIENGDKIVEIHLNNKKMKELGSSIKQIFRAFDQEMKLLAHAMIERDKYKNIKGVYGRTVLYLITEKRGFETYEIDDPKMFKFIRIWDNIIKYAYDSKENKLKLREPKEIWISRDKFLSVQLKD